MAIGFSRRAQTASSAAVLVAIIGGLLILYILFLPPSQREQLLFGDGSYNGGGGSYGGGGSGTIVQYGNVLVFRETPGTLRQLRSTTQEHAIPSATVFTRVDTQEIKSVDSAAVQNGVFARRDLEMTFNVDREATRNFLLSFNIPQAGYAPLRILVNGQQVFERPVYERTPAPIPLPIEYLVDGENTLRIETEDVGLAFWRSNTYILDHVLISADVLDTSGAVSEQQFSISETELASFEEAQLTFVPDCDPRTAGRLTVQLNSRVVQDVGNRTLEVPNLLYTGFVDCGIQFKTEVPKSSLRAGENRLLFAAQGGQYVVDRIKLIVRLKAEEYPTYYFNLPRELYDTLDLGRGELRLTMTFSDYTTEKRGEVVVNGFVQSFRTSDYAWQAIIDPAVLTPGPNTIQITPGVDRLDIAELKLELI